MDGSGEVIRPFGGAERMFRLDIDRVRAVQAATDCGPLELLRRIEIGTWRVDDLREVMFHGLVGGEMSQAAATALMIANFDNPKKGYAQFAPIAHAIVSATAFGPEDDPVGEAKAEAKTRTRSRATKSGSGGSSERRRS